MKQLIFTAPNVTELLEVDVPAMGENDVLVKIERSSISAGTERANLVGDPSVSGASAPKVKFPRTVGYSSSGVVEAIGANVTRVKVGDRVVVGKYVGTDITLDKVDYKFVKQDDILAVVTD